MPPGEPFVEGKEKIYARVGANMAAGPTTDFVITPLETTSAGDWAYSRGVYTVTFPLGDGGEEGTIDGKFMTILQRQPDGTWKIHRDIYNSNVPPAPAVAPETDVNEVSAAVDAIWREYEASLAAGDVDRWMDLWADGGVKLSPGLPPIIGKDAIREYLTPRVEAFAYEMTITNEEIEVGGGWAIARGGYIATLTPKAGGDVIPVDGKYMTLLQQQDDGSWKIYRDITNSNVPPTPPTDVNEVAAAVDAIWREYEASLLAGDADRWIGLWAEDGVQLPPGAPAVNGKEAIYAGIVSDLDMYEYTEFVIVPEELSVNGDMAISRGVYTVTFVAKTGGDPISFEGKYMTFISQQKDGTWKIYRDIFNSNVP
jgi:uncharacterized protein (TIGR02246 family)